MFRSILVVCSGNICRSPMAEGLLGRELGPGTVVGSVGHTAMVGYPADPTAVDICRQAGIDISAHRARQATRELLFASDLILAMAQEHADWVKRSFPQLLGRTHKFLRWRGNGDVVDPYKLPREVFEQAFADIRDGVADWVPRIRN